MKDGIVKWFHDGKGFGFIQSEGKDYFVHYKEIKRDGYKTLASNEPVRFEPGVSDKGNIAKNVYPGYTDYTK